MNWLAHLRLAPSAPLLRLGNLAGDFVRGIDVTALHPDVQRGIEQHRAIDRFVDRHAVVRASRGLLESPLRRFGGVALDVFFDHFLARDWQRHGDGRPLDAFVTEVHEQLEAHRDLLPPDLRAASRRMAQHGWLSIYGTVDGIDVVLRAMARRSPRAAPLATASGQLRRHYRRIEGAFVQLWPDLLAFARDHGR